MLESSFGRRPIPLKLARRMQTYLKYQWSCLRGVDESTFFAGLPPILRSEVLVFLNASLLRRIPRFAGVAAGFELRSRLRGRCRCRRSCV